MRRARPSAPVVVGALLLTMGSASAHVDSPALPTRDLEHEACELPPYSELEILAAVGDVDCTVSTSTGYSQGNPFPIEVVHIGGKAVEVETANAFLVMQEAAAEDGVTIGIVSGFRTYEEQDYLYGCYVNCNCNSCNLAARPGYSNHNSGHALDLNTSSPGVYDWLASNAGFFGFERTVPSEDWHWEWWGGGPGGGQCSEPFSCPAIPAQGRTIEDSDECFVERGQSQYWRRVDAGQGGTLIWTKATESAEPANYAAWNLLFDEAGTYDLEVYSDGGEYGQSAQAAYLVTHAQGQDVVVIDQSSTEGFLSLGAFEFDREGEYSVRLDDNTGEPWAEDPGGVRVLFDALQVRPTDDEEPGPEKEPDSDSSGLIGGCASGGAGGTSPAMAMLLLLMLLRSRRRRPRPASLRS